MGEMDFSYQVSDEIAARQAIDNAMRKQLPAAQFRVTATDD